MIKKRIDEVLNGITDKKNFLNLEKIPVLYFFKKEFRDAILNILIPKEGKMKFEINFSNSMDLDDILMELTSYELNSIISQILFECQYGSLDNISIFYFENINSEIHCQGIHCKNINNINSVVYHDFHYFTTPVNFVYVYFGDITKKGMYISESSISSSITSYTPECKIYPSKAKVNKITVLISNEKQNDFAEIIRLIQHDLMAVASYLIRQTVGNNKKDKDQHYFNPLTQAVIANNKPLVTAILEEDKSFLYEKTKNGFTPFMFAAQYNFVDLANTLFRAGSPVYFSENNDLSFVYAAQQNFTEIVELILNNCNGFINIRERLLEQKSTARIKKDALYWSIYNYNFTIFELLVNAGANINQKRSNGMIMLHWVLQRNDEKFAEKILSKLAQHTNTYYEVQLNKEIINTPFENETPLDLAEKRRYCDVAKILISLGAKVNSQIKKLPEKINNGNTETIRKINFAP